jgi:dipeptidase E
MPHPHILAFSSSRSGNSGYLENAIPVLKNILKDKMKIAFIPFASAGNAYEEYYEKVSVALKDLPGNLMVALPENSKAIIQESDAVMVGGGNTFKLLHDLLKLDLLNIISNKIKNGAAYIGWSAGSNILGPTIGTTNDMPIIYPASFKALDIFPFQINPHYFNQKIEGFNGETREQRLEEFLQLNRGGKIIGLPGRNISGNERKYFKISRPRARDYILFIKRR